MNREAVEQEIHNIIGQCRTNNPRKQSPANKTQIKRVEELGILDMMPSAPGLTTPGNIEIELVIKAAEDTGPSNLYLALNWDVPNPGELVLVNINRSEQTNPNWRGRIHPDMTGRIVRTRGMEIIVDIHHAKGFAFHYLLKPEDIIARYTDLPHDEPDGTSPWMIENQKGVAAGEDWLKLD